MNHQNLPRRDTTVKRAFIPKRGAFSFLDYQSIEPRLAAYLAARIGYPEFAEKIRAGADPYTAVASLVTGNDEITPEERQTWKRMFLSLMYGGGTFTIQEQFGVSAKEARSMIRTFHEGWPAVRALSDDIQGVAASRGYVRGIDGRHLHPEEHGLHKMLNKWIQGSAAGIMKQSLLAIHRYIQAKPDLQSRMVSVVHDEVIFDGPVAELETLHRDIPPLMIVYPHVHEVVPILVDHEVSVSSWAEKVAYDEWLSSQAQEVAA